MRITCCIAWCRGSNRAASWPGSQTFETNLGRLGLGRKLGRKRRPQSARSCRRLQVADTRKPRKMPQKTGAWQPSCSSQFGYGDAMQLRSHGDLRTHAPVAEKHGRNLKPRHQFPQLPRHSKHRNSSVLCGRPTVVPVSQASGGHRGFEQPIAEPDATPECSGRTGPQRRPWNRLSLQAGRRTPIGPDHVLSDRGDQRRMRPFRRLCTKAQKWPALRSMATATRFAERNERGSGTGGPRDSACRLPSPERS